MKHVPSSSQSAAPSEIRRIAIDPISRVEGHGKVTLLLDEAGIVVQARLHIVEFRGFERFIQGRPYWEVPVMVQRLCGICPVSHHLAASKAMDQIIGAHLTPSAEKLRRLMHAGQILQSHALHFFHLSSPDLLLGFASEAARRNLFTLAETHPDLLKKGVLLRKFGQEVIRHTAGKRIHGTGSIPGGVNRSLDQAARAELAGEIGQIVEWSREAVQLIKRLLTSDAQTRDFCQFKAKSMGLVRADGAMDLYHGKLRVIADSGETLVDQFAAERYWDLLGETVKPWSYMKFPFLKTLGSEQGWYRVGPLARIALCDFIPTPLADLERGELLAWNGATETLLAYHWARMIEMLHAAETIAELLGDDDLCGSELVERGGEHQERGVGVIEAPRGTLIHHYRVNEDDLVERANLIVSTTHNNQAMNEAITLVAKKYLSGQEITEPLLNHIEIAIRCFDPCLSCATHALGQMPLEVCLLGPTGQVLDSALRGEDGLPLRS